MMNRNRKLFSRGLRPLMGAATALLLGLGLLGAPGAAWAAANPTAAQTVYHYWAAVDRHDYPAAYEQFSAAYRQDHGYQQFALTHWSSVQHAGNVQIIREDTSGAVLRPS